MKAKVSVTEFRDALGVASLTLSKRLGAAENALLYLEARKNGALYLFSFDGIARTFVKIPATVTEEGKTVINPTLLLGSMSQVIQDGELTLSQGEKKDQLSITGAGRRMKFSASGELDTFSSLIYGSPNADGTLVGGMPLGGTAAFTINAATFKKLIKLTAPFVDRPDKEDTAEFNRGDSNLLIKPTPTGYEAVATDGNTMAVVRVADDTVQSTAETLKIPLMSVINLNKMLDKLKGQTIIVILDRDENNNPRGLYLRTDNLFYGTRLDASQFRDYGKVLGLNVSYQVSLPKAHFQALVSNAAPFARGIKDEDRLVTVLVAKDKLRVQAGSKEENFEEDLAVTPVAWPEGKPPLELTFKPDYLTNVARVIAGDTVTLSVADNSIITFLTAQTDDAYSIYAVAKYFKGAAVPKTKSQPEAKAA